LRPGGRVGRWGDEARTRLTGGLVWLTRVERGATAMAWDAEAARCAGAVGLLRRVRLLRSPGVNVPMTAGVLEPVVILPESSAGWSVERRRLVLLHELAHVKRLDWLSVVVCEVATAFWWVHPRAWWVLRAAHIEAEKATDDLVVRAGERPSVYAGHLVEMVRALRGERATAGAMPMARASDLEARLRALLDGKGRGPASSRGRALAATLVVSAALLAVVRPIAAAEAAEPRDGKAWRQVRAYGTGQGTEVAQATGTAAVTETASGTETAAATEGARTASAPAASSSSAPSTARPHLSGPRWGRPAADERQRLAKGE
jgi:hypothetical protein